MRKRAALAVQGRGAPVVYILVNELKALLMAASVACEFEKGEQKARERRHAHTHTHTHTYTDTCRLAGTMAASRARTQRGQHAVEIGGGDGGGKGAKAVLLPQEAHKADALWADRGARDGDETKSGVVHA